jgi:DNA-binding response OmpR family regulator
VLGDAITPRAGRGLAHLGDIALAQDEIALIRAQTQRAARLFGAAELLRRTMQAPLTPSDRAHHDHTITTIRAQLGELAFATAWVEGQTLTLEQAIAEALER